MRYVIKNSNELGIDECWYSRTKKRREITGKHPYWYVFDKEEKEIVEGMRFMERRFAKRHAVKKNEGKI